MSLVRWCIAAAIAANVAVYFLYQPASERSVQRSAGDVSELKLLSELDSPPPPRVADGQVMGDSLPRFAPVDPTPADAIASAATGAPAGPPVESPRGGASPGSGPVPQDRCWLAGPVIDDALGVTLSQLFDSAGISMDLVLQTVEAEPEYWVYVPTDGTRTEVRRVSLALRENGLESFPINEGALSGSVSVGLFRSVARAEAMQQRLAGWGFEGEIFERPRYRDEAWLSLDDAAREALGWPAADGSVPGYPGLRMISVPCEAR